MEDAADTVTVLDALPEPPVPVQVTVYVVVEPGETEFEPEVAVPLPKFFEQEVAFVEDQVRVEEPPLVIEVGEAFKVTVGAGMEAETVTVAEAPISVPLSP